MASATAIEADGSWLKAAHAKRRVSGSERAEVRVHTTALCSPTRQALLTEWYPAIYDGTTPMEQSKSPEEGYHFTEEYDGGGRPVISRRGNQVQKTTLDILRRYQLQRPGRGAGCQVFWMDIAVDIPLTSWLGSVKLGRQKVGLSQEWIMPGADWIFMERSGMANAFIAQRNIGMRLHRSFADGRATYSVGAFNDWFVNDRSMSANGNQYTGRFEFLPVDRDADHTVVSVAAGVYYKEKIDGTLQYRSRPEANQSPYFVDTDKFAANHSTTTQFEVMAMSGPTQVFGELMLTPANAPTVGDPFFYGGFVGASHFLTGEHRTFNREDGHNVSKFVPRSPFGFGHVGIGAWEVSGRYSYVDLADGAIDGGVMSRLTGAISWYPEEHWRIEFNYGHGILDRGGTQGHFDVFEGRAQFGLT